MTKFTKTFGVIFLLFSMEYAYAVVTPQASNVQFIENKGQIVDQNYNPNGAVKYLLCGPGFNVQLRATGFSYDTYSDEAKNTTGVASNKKISQQIAGLSHAADFTRHYHRVDVELLNCNPAAEIAADGMSSFSFNYFTGGTPQGGVRDVHSYRRVIYKNIYPFIDLEFISNDNDKQQGTPAEYQFILHPGARMSDIQLSYNGADESGLKNGQLNIKVVAGVFSEKIPNSYLKESGKQVEVHYVSSGNNVYTFSTKHFFAITSDLVIDPVPCFAWGTYYGGNGWDLGSGIALDNSNNVYVAGSTTSTNNIATAGAYQTTFSAGILYNIIVAKFDPTGTTLLWGTYYGGTGGDCGENSLAIDTSGVYITGYSHNNGLATVGAWQTTCPNCNETDCDIIVAKFSLSGALLWGTYYGTSGYGQGNDIVVNASGVYIAGETNGGYTGFTTPGAWQTAYAGALDPFVAKFNLSGSQLLWGTFYGVNYDGLPWGICLDTSGNVYIGGYTNGPDSTKITPGAYQTADSGGDEGFVAKFNPTGSSLLYGTYYGGTGDDIIYGIKADASGNAYFTGNTTSKSGIATAGAWQTTNGADNVFVAKLNPSGSSLLWGTYYGGSVQEECRSIILDATNNIYIMGGTESTNGIATAGAYQTALKGPSDAFIAKFNSTGSSLLWGTYYGGPGYDNPPGGTTYLRLGGIALDATDNIYITGFTSSYVDMASAGAWQEHLSAPPDAFVAKFGCNSTPVAAFVSSDTTICAYSCINLTSLSTNADSWQWLFPGANPDTSSAPNPQNICYTDSGSYDVTLIVSGAGETDTLLLTGFIKVNAAPPTPTVIQSGDTLFSSTDPTYTSYQWFDGIALIPGATDTFLVINQGGNYNIQVSNEYGCKVAVGIVLGIDNPAMNKFNIYPNPATNQLTITGLPANGGKEILEVFNMLSQRVYSSIVNHENATIDVSGFSGGVYYLRLQSNGEGVIRKFIKE